jgi:photosystem II oxygen-evolving enhancer protein 2
MCALWVLVIGLSLTAVPPAIAANNFKQYANVPNGYEFSYPNGWVEVKVASGPDVVFHDIIETTENVSVVINPIQGSKTLAELGSPGEVGYRLSKAAIAPPDSGRVAELVDAEAREIGGLNYYLLEYAVKLPSQQLRHNLASAVIRNGKLYTFNLSTREQRWEKLKPMFQAIVQSFQVY